LIAEERFGKSKCVVGLSKAVNRQGNLQVKEARAAPRERAFLKARVSYNDGAISMSCTVVQISPSGARLNFDSIVSLPEIFDIEVPHKSIACRAKLVWRDRTLAGVEFVPEAVASHDGNADYLAKIRTLEALNAKFKAQIAELTSQVRRLTEEV
jgi:PilZ domain